MEIKTPNCLIVRDELLSHQDSNLNKQNQNLLCYHYTMRQSGVLSFKSGAKVGV